MVIPIKPLSHCRNYLKFLCTLPKEVDEEIIALLKKYLNTYQRIAFSEYHQKARDYFRIGDLNKEGIRVEGSLKSPYLHVTLKRDAIERFYKMLNTLEKGDFLE